jgi:CMP-N,N'-diacetyllegionaminic acid synthase
VRNIAIIPARSGSKGLEHKNIKILNGKPLIAYAIEAAQKSNLFDEIFVSTDSDEYARIAREWGASVPFLRSKELSSDTASSWDVVSATLKEYEKLGRCFDTFTLLQPTSPLRTSDDILGGYNEMNIKNANAIVGVCEVDHSPLWSNTLPEDLSLNKFIEKDFLGVPRQSLPTYYRINGALYIARVSYFNLNEDIYNERCYAYIMKIEASVDIDNELDFTIAETLILNQVSQKNC